MPFEFFPNTNFHDLNLDYILEKAQKIDDNLRDSQASADAAKASEEAAAASEAAAQLSEEAAAASEAAAKDYADHIADPVSGLVTEWLEDNITQETGYVLDASLMSDAAAAPAKTVGDVLRGINRWGESGDLSFLAALYQGSYINNSDAIVANASLSHTDYIAIPKGAYIMDVGNLTSSGGSTFNINPNVIYYDSAKTRLGTRVSTSNIGRYYIPSNAAYVRVNQPIIDAATKEMLIKFTMADTSGFIGAVEITSASGTQGTAIYLTAGHVYRLYMPDPLEDGHVNAFIAGHTSHFASLYRSGFTTFIPQYTGYMALANIDAVLSDPLQLYVYDGTQETARAFTAPAIYNVGPSQYYKSFTGLLYQLRFDTAPKIIYLDGADYDIFQEYTDLGLLEGDGPDNPSTGYFDYNVWVPANTHIIGRGLVRLIWTPTANQITENWSKTISPLNMAASATVENVEIVVKNGRYCIHDDPLGILEYRDAHKSYKKVRCLKMDNDTGYGFSAVIGFGLDSRMTYDFDSCELTHEGSGPAFYMHDRTTNPNTAGAGATVNVNNTVITTAGQGVSLGNGSSAASGNHHIRVRFNSCYIGGSFRVGDEANKLQGNNPNHFDITLLQCNDVPVQIASVTNPYPAKIYCPIS